MQRENKSANLMPIKIATYIYMIAAFGYGLYSLLTQTGLCGYIMDVQLRWFGVAYEKLAALIAMLILFTPAALILIYIEVKKSSIFGAAYNALPVSTRPRPISWKSLLIVSLAPILIALPAYYVLIRMDQNDQQREVYKVDLNRESAAPSGDVKFVQLTGVVQLDYQYRLERKSRTESRAETTKYAPLTGSGWTKEGPIRFFMNTTTSGYFDPQTRRIISFSGQGAVAATFDGKLTQNGLPTYVENEYKRSGLLIESPYFVMDRMSFVNGRIPSESQQYHMIPILGAGLSVAVLVGGSIGLMIRKLRRAG